MEGRTKHDLLMEYGISEYLPTYPPLQSWSRYVAKRERVYGNEDSRRLHRQLHLQNRRKQIEVLSSN